MINPVNKIYIVRGFTDSHSGVDYGWNKTSEKNQNIIACESGIVIYNRYQLSGGYVIIIKHDNGFCSVYGHLLKDSQKVKEGSVVKKGQVIAKMGKSGKNCNGNHLHFGLYKGSKVLFNKKYYVNPLKYVNVYSNQTIGEGTKKNYNLLHTKKVLAKTGLNVRTLPNPKGKIVDTLKYGSEVEYYGLYGEWAIIDNIKGYYVYNKYLGDI